MALSVTHLFKAKNIKFLDKTLATQHLTTKNYPQKDPKNDPTKLSLKKTPLIHAHKAQDRAEISIIRYMKQVKTEFFS